MSLTLEEARALHEEVHVLDLHADTAKLMDKLGYDLAARHERPMPKAVNVFGHVDLPRMRDGGMAGAVLRVLDRCPIPSAAARSR